MIAEKRQHPRLEKILPLKLSASLLFDIILRGVYVGKEFGKDLFGPLADLGELYSSPVSIGKGLRIAPDYLTFSLDEGVDEVYLEFY